MSLIKIILTVITFTVFYFQSDPTTALILSETPQVIVDTATPSPTAISVIELSATPETNDGPSVSPAENRENSALAGILSYLRDLSLEFFGAVIFAGFVGLYLYFRQRRIENSEQIKISNESKRRYLISIKAEIASNLALLKPIFQDYQHLLETESFKRLIDDKNVYSYAANHVTQATTTKKIFSAIRKNFIKLVLKKVYWEALISSGLLPSLADELLLKEVADFYYTLRIIEISSTPASTDAGIFHEWAYRITVALPTVKELSDNGDRLINKLQAEIDKFS